MRRYRRRRPYYRRRLTRFARRGRFRRRTGIRRRRARFYAGRRLRLGSSLFPRKTVKTLRYAQDVSFDVGAAGTPVLYMWRANGVYDPNFSGVGHQPSGFDTMMEHYSTAVVIKARITASMFNDDPTNANRYCLLPTVKNASITGDQRVLMEQMNGKSGILAPRGSAGCTRTVSYTLNPNKFMSVSSPLSEEGVFNSSSGNPTRTCYFHLYVFPQQASEDTAPVRVYVTIDFTVVFFGVIPDNLVD